MIRKTHIFLSSIGFVLGFSVAFTLLGASATSAGHFLVQNKAILAKGAGILIILLGMHMLGLFKFNFLYREKRIQIHRKPPGFLGALLVGFAFAFGWTPCIGPFLGATLALAAQKETVWQGITLLLFFSLGLGIPFLFTSLAIGTFFNAFQRIKHYFRWIELSGGTLLICIGVLLLIGGFTRLARFASGLPDLGLGPSAENLSFLSAFLAGIIAFLSPCVLPLIPGYISYISGFSLETLQNP